MADEDLKSKNNQNSPNEDGTTTDSNNLFNENWGLNSEPADSEDSPGDNKVELDLDDAPFLVEENAEEEPENSSDSGTEALSLPEQETKLELKGWRKLLKNKKILIGAGAGLLLIIGLVLFLFLSENEPEEPPQVPDPPKPEETEVLPPIEAKPGEILIEWEPFWIEYTDENGEIRFLVCELSAPTTDPELKTEADAKQLTIRDAIYYYLSHKPLMFLSSQSSANAMKEDLAGIVNGYLTRGQLTQIYIENYLIR